MLARARDRRHAWQLMDLGVTPIRETFGSSLEMGCETLVSLGMDAEVAARRGQLFRELDERILAAQHLAHDDEDALMQTAQDARKELEALFEADLGEGMLGQMAEATADPRPRSQLN